MIIYSGAYLSSTQESLWLPRIGYQTWARGLSPSAVSVSSETTEGPRDAPLRPETLKFWLAASNPATYILNLGALRDINYVGLAGHEFGSKGVSVKAETDIGDDVWTALSLELMPADNSPIVFLDTLRSHSRMKLTLTGGTPAKLASIYVGTILTMEKPLQLGFRPPNLSRTDELTHAMGRSGQFLGQNIRRMGVDSNPSFKFLSESWYRQKFEPFTRAALNFPYFFVWNPLAFPTEVAYAWTKKPIKPSGYGTHNSLNVSWDLEGIGYV